MKQRITYLDTTKALLIALVVIGHVLQYANPEYNILPYTLAQAFIYSFLMSAFFLLCLTRRAGKRARGARFCSGAHGRFWFRISFLRRWRRCTKRSYFVRSRSRRDYIAW